MKKSRVSIGLIGLDERGTALARAFRELPHAELVRVSHLGDAPGRLPAVLSGVERVPDWRELVADAEIDAVGVAAAAADTPALVRAALEAGKHVIVEPPLATSGEEAEDLLAEAERRRRCLLVGHAILFEPVIRKLKELIDVGRLGTIRYVHSSHQSLGPIRTDESVVWAHGHRAIAPLVYLLDDEPVEVAARGGCHVEPEVEDVVTGTLRFGNGVDAHIHLSRLDPQGVHRLTIVGSKKTAVVDEAARDRRLTLHADVVQPSGSQGAHRRVRRGDVVSPRIPSAKPEQLECDHFLAAIRAGRHAATRPGRPAAVVRVLEALQRSVERGGLPQPVRPVVAPRGNVTPLPKRREVVWTGT